MKMGKERIRKEMEVYYLDSLRICDEDGREESSKD